MKNKIYYFIAVLALLSFAVQAEETKEVKKKIIYKQRTSLDFDDAVIEGEMSNLDSFYYVHRDQEKFDSLVKKKKNFHKEQLRDNLMVP